MSDKQPITKEDLIRVITNAVIEVRPEFETPENTAKYEGVMTFANELIEQLHKL